MARLHIRKIKVLSSQNIYYAIFEEGDLSHPLCLMSDSEAKDLFEEYRAQVIGEEE